MTQPHYSFPSIEQFRTVIKYVNDRCAHRSVTDKPTLLFHGTVKLHGTNSSVVYTKHCDIYAQSRETVITPEKDNAGFARFVHEHKVLFTMALDQILDRYNSVGFLGEQDYEQKNAHTVVVYGEWCGKGIQKGVAINQLDKMFVVFAIKMVADGMVMQDGELVPGQTNTWLMPWHVQTAFDDHIKASFIGYFPIYCIEDSKTWQVKIDFNNPAEAQNKLAELTMAVEQECPFGKDFGVSGVGEGIVWTCIGGVEPVSIPTHDLTFKVKGEKHSDTKVKTLAAVDIEKVNSIKACAELVGTPHRFEKGLAYLKEQHPNEDVLDNRFVGEFLKWVGNDVLKEETDTIIGNGLEPKDVTKSVNLLAKKWFMGQNLFLLGDIPRNV